MLRIVSLLMAALSLQATVTTYKVRTTGGDYAMTATGFRNAWAACRDLNDPGGICIVDVEAYSVASTCITDSSPFSFGAQTNGTKLILLRSSRISELPAFTRVGRPEGAGGSGKLACLENNGSAQDAVVLFPGGVTNTGNTNCQTYPGAVVSHVVMQGFELRATGSGKNLSVVSVGLADSACVARQKAQAPHTIILDRLWLHGVDTEAWITGASTHALIDGVRWYGDKITLMNSTCEELNTPTTDTPESHCISADNAPEASVAINNYFDAAIGSLWGGGYPQRRGFSPVRVRTYGNEYTRTAWSFHKRDDDTSSRLDTGNPCTPNMMWSETVSPNGKWKCDGAGAWQTSSETRTKSLWAKNAWEVKSAADVDAEGNYVHHIFPTGDGNQSGPAFLINNVDSSASANAYWARPYKIRLRFNRSVLTGAGLQTSWSGPAYLAVMRKQMRRIDFEHNLMEGVNHVSIHPTQGGGTLFGVPFGGVGVGAAFSGIESGLRFRHNTVTYGQTFGGLGIAIEDDGVPNIMRNADIRENIGYWASVGQRPSIGNEACSAFTAAMAQTAHWDRFALVDTNSRGATAFNNIYNGTGCPSSKARLALGSEGFVDYNGGYDGDYRVCTGSGTPDVACGGASTAATMSESGGPIGADAAQVRVLTDDAAAGTFDPSKYAVRIKRVSSGEIAYVAREPQGVCTITVTRNGSTVFNGNDAANLGAVERTVDPELDTNGEHVVRVSCLNAAATGSVWREARWVRAE